MAYIQEVGGTADTGFSLFVSTEKRKYYQLHWTVLPQFFTPIASSLRFVFNCYEGMQRYMVDSRYDPTRLCTAVTMAALTVGLPSHMPWLVSVWGDYSKSTSHASTGMQLAGFQVHAV
jgi:hypothetical protein